jgi:RNA ligase
MEEPVQLAELFSEAELQAQMDAGMVKATPDPSGRLTILNYTKRAQFTPELWNHVTDKCRGLIVDGDGNVVARAFEKFWNLNDVNHPETMVENLPVTSPLLTRKLDGSLGIGYELDRKWRVATRGSFTSDQAVWASDWLGRESPSVWPAGWTPLFEIVYPDNQIVVRYEFSGLVLLTLVKIETGEEVGYDELLEHGERNRIRVVEKFDRPLAECVAEDVRNEEGYVAAWPRADRTPLRCKIKYANYVRLHRLLTQTNAVTVWEMLRDGLDIVELTTDVPDAFRSWIDAMVRRFRGAFEEIESVARVAMDGYSGEKKIVDAEQKKAFAMYVLGEHKQLSGILFAMISGKNYAPIVWKTIRPRGDEEKTFKVDEP